MSRFVICDNASVANVKRSCRGEEKGGGFGREENEEKYLSPFFFPSPPLFAPTTQAM